MRSNPSYPSYADRLTSASSARRTALEVLFNSELFSLTSMMGPVNDGPSWPSDAAWLAGYLGDAACIISDGLSDPWVELDRPATGLGLEVFVASPDVGAHMAESLLDLADTWLFPMTAEISHTLATYPRLASQLLRKEPVAIRFNIEHIKDGRGLVGAMLHIPPPWANGITTLAGKIELVAATLLTADELGWLVGKKLPGRQQLLAQLYAQGVGYRSLSGRGSVIKESRGHEFDNEFDDE